jgi:hypothetical protein
MALGDMWKDKEEGVEEVRVEVEGEPALQVCISLLPKFL